MYSLFVFSTPQNSLGECKYFSHDVLLPPNVTNGVMVRCKGSVSPTSKTRKSVYTNVHAFIRAKPAVQERLERFRDSYKQRPLSVLMVGIDSISRLNLIRAMPHTAQHLYDTGWFELKGYNKVSSTKGSSTSDYLIHCSTRRSMTIRSRT